MKDYGWGLERHLSHQGVLMKTLVTNGYAIDGVDHSILKSLGTIGTGRMTIGDSSFSIMVVPGIRGLPLADMERTAEFCRKGGTVITTLRLPEIAYGFKDHEKSAARFKVLSEELYGGFDQRESLQDKAVGRGRSIFVNDEMTQLVKALGELPQDAVMEQGDPDIGFVHRRVERQDFYFLANITREAKRRTVRFRAGNRRPRVWDPMTGQIRDVAGYSFRGDSTLVPLDFEPYGSVIVEFGSSTAAPSGPPPAPAQAVEVARVNGPWKFQPHRAGASAAGEMVQLASWVNQPQLRCFSGTATYETSITVPGQALAQRPALVLDLGDVRDVAEVWVNGKQVGITWRMPYKLPIGEYLQAGTNTLRVDVTNLLINTVLCQPIKDYTEIEKTYQIGTHLRPPEFTFDLPGPLPEQLATAARAGEEHRERIYALCERMRGADDTREGYIERARSVEQQLRLGELTRELPQLGVRDTFPFEERIYLGRLETLAKTGKVVEAREVVERRRRSVWRYLPERAVLWKLAERCVDFLAAAAAGPHRSEAAVRGWIQAYTAADGLWQVDRLQRLVEQGAAACAESEEAAGLVSLCRQRYREVAGKAQAGFLQAVERDGWPPDGVFRQTQTFERYVAPVLEERRKAVYFLVDSMRYEMGRDLGTALDPFGPVSVTAAVTVLPTTTPCGMAALMPGADGTFTLVADGEDLAPAVAGRVLRNSADRMTLLRERYGDRFRDLALGDLLSMS